MEELEEEAGYLHWYVVQCKPLKEREAATALREYLGVSTYLAEVSKRVRGEMVPRPFFPGYIFAQADLGEVALSGINATPYVLRLLAFGGEPQRIPGGVVEAIRERIEDLNSRGGLTRHSFKPDDPVRFASGPYKDLEAVFVGPMPAGNRVRVLLQFFNRLHELKVEADDLEPASSLPAPRMGRGTRGTRGRGRKIERRVPD